jgi:hypothetical protein
MTKYTVDANGSSVAIELTEVAGRHAELLETFGECQEGRCSCPTDEYRKVATMEVQPTGDRIAMRLQAKPGTILDATGDRRVPRLHRGQGRRVKGRTRLQATADGLVGTAGTELLGRPWANG